MPLSIPDKEGTDTHPLILDEEERKKLAEFDQRISAISKELAKKIGPIKEERLEYLRSIARKKGISAQTLEELKSERGEPFVEVESKDSEGYKKAKALLLPPSSPKGMALYEESYLCSSTHIGFGLGGGKEDSCGWVKGSPNVESYDDIAFLSGSAGYRYYCKICGKLIGTEMLIVS